MSYCLGLGGTIFVHCQYFKKRTVFVRCRGKREILGNVRGDFAVVALHVLLAQSWSQDS